MADAPSQAPFKPFLVEGGRGGKVVFRVIELDAHISRDKIERLLERLPVGFSLRQRLTDPSINEPLEVRVSGVIVSIFPPRGRILVYADFDSWNNDACSKMHVDNLFDLSHPGNGQIRACVHFAPSVLGIDGWAWGNETDSEIEIDIHAFPINRGNEPPLDALYLDKFHVRDLISLVAGGDDKNLPVEAFQKFRDVLLYTAETVRRSYENGNLPPEAHVRRYYAPVWQQLQTAKSDEERAAALTDLRDSIKME
ncbi:MAG: hypothetical protein Q7R83_01635 [bacterium]|nr:hypothetical protein [bacterium]